MSPRPPHQPLPVALFALRWEKWERGSLFTQALIWGTAQNSQIRPAQTLRHLGEGQQGPGDSSSRRRVGL